MMTIVQINHMTIQNKQNSRRFLCIITTVVQYAQKTTEMLKLFVQNRKSYNSVTLVTKRLQNGYKTVTSTGRLRPRRRLAWLMVLLIYYIRVKELRNELRWELRRARAHARTTEMEAFAFLRSYVSERHAAALRHCAHKNKIIIFYSVH